MMRNMFILLIFLSFFSGQLLGKELNSEKSYIVHSIEWNSPAFIKEIFRGYFLNLRKKNLDQLGLKIKSDLINKELQTLGYYDSSLSLDYEILNENQVRVKLNFKMGNRTSLYFKGNKLFSFQELKNKVSEKIRSDFGKIDLELLKVYLNDLYEEAGLYNTRIDIHVQKGKDLDGSLVSNYIFDISEGDKISVSKISFRGLNNISSTELLNLFYEQGTSLSKENFYDKKFTESFTSLIKKQYLSKGFVYVEVSLPRIVNNDDDSVDIEYVINEKTQFILNEFKLDNSNDLINEELKDKLVNKVGKPINIPELENDFKKIISFYQSKGYYFVSISNLNSNDLIKYDTINSKVDIKLNLNLDRQICFNEIVLNGNLITKNQIVEREVLLKKGEIITPDSLEVLRQKISGLGLFSNLRITPYMLYEDDDDPNKCAKTNLIIQVKEKDFRFIEFSPGFRTDIGGKVAVGVTYNNIGGMNRSLTIKAQGNERFNLNGFDERRRLENKKLIEFSSKVSIADPYFLYDVTKTQLEFETSLSGQRKRFTSFDADIFRISPQVSKNFTKTFSSSVKYQLERIRQFDATETKDNDNFTIGSITPSFTLDLRDDPVNPRKGSYFNVSSEWANPYFGSMKQNDFEVNYVKFISRNKFYKSIGNFVFATSLSVGFEKNYAEGVYIPSIKVFRLDGFDEIRGFDDSEINRLIDGSSISKVVVSDKAYFVAFKFEPRYNITDNVQFDVFFDAGRVFVNEFQPLNLRTSVGAGIKFITPVGSLDFDYGVKLKRERYPDGIRDAVGRFHLSIGFF